MKNELIHERIKMNEEKITMIIESLTLITGHIKTLMEKKE